ncbi:MAG: transposase, partial [Candidatus Micrarchaeota archaeon]|nr:transposase [Candidatus Micrarchaeota archaeon]
EQRAILEFTLNGCRLMYNSLLEELKKQEKIDRKRVQHKIVELKEHNPDFNRVYSKTLQYECYRLFSNLTTLRNLKNNGKKVGRLRFKGKEWFKTVVYNQSGFWVEWKTEKRSVVHLSKIGSIKIKTHRSIDGCIKGLIIKKSCDRWYMILQTDAKRKNLKQGNKSIGIDLGIKSYLTCSNGEQVSNPKILERYLGTIASMQKQLSKKMKGSKNRLKTKKRLEKLYKKVADTRNDFIHKTTTMLVKRCKLIAVEKLGIKRMMEQPYYNARNIADASWNRFLQTLRYKAESAGCEIREIDPRGTTKTCSVCGNVKDMPLYKRMYVCNICGMSMDRDHNAAINILKKASGGMEWASVEGMKAYPMNQEISDNNLR